jgi:Kef-type K+ transport system membrane component KefB
VNELNEYVIFLIILASGLFFSEVFKRLHLPYVVALIAAGIFIGPLGLDIVELTPPMEFLGSLGAVFLMFMAGMEVRTDILAQNKKKLMIVALINGGIPALLGFAVTLFFGYDTFASMLIGTIFISSSIAVIIPSLEEKGVMETDIGTLIVGAVMIEDIGSLFILSLLLQTADPTSTLPLPAFIAVIVISIILLKSILPRLETEFFKKIARAGFEEKLQFVFVLLVAVAVYFELLGMHAIVAGFLVGLILSGTIRQEHVETKLHALSYGIFIPVFFLTVGVETDLTVFQKAGDALILTLAITGGLITSKVLSGYLAGHLLGFKGKKNLLVGFASVPQLSTSLAVAFTALELGLLDSSLQVGIVFLSIVTVLIAPFIVGSLAKSALEK